jgi:hypothetical protein
MVVRHLTLKGKNEEIGAQLARIAKSRHKTALGEPKPEILSARRSWFEKHYPNHAERAKGVARDFGARESQDAFELDYDLDFQPACSTVFYPPSSTQSGHATMSRNYDFSTGTYAQITGRPGVKGARAMTGDPYVIAMHPEKGIPSLYICSYDLLGGCIDGMNSEGLAVALLANDYEKGQPTYGSRPGLGEIEITRYLLDTCANVDDARKTLEKIELYYSFIGCHYMVCDRKGRSFVFEYTPDLSKRFFVEGRGGPQVVTNHPLHLFDRQPLPDDPSEFGSFSRYGRIQKQISKIEKLRVDQIKAANRCASPMGDGNVAPGGQLGRTLWHSIYDLEEGTLLVDFYLGEDPKSPDLHQHRSGYLPFRLQ